MRIAGTEPSPVILSKLKEIQKVWRKGGLNMT